MNKKNVVGLIAIALGCGLLSWFLGRQFTAKPAASFTEAPASGPLTSKLKPIGGGALPMKAPATPAHEKAFLEEQLKKNPDHAPILVRLGEMEKEEGKFPEARKHLEDAVKIDPSLIDGRLELSLVCYQLGDIDQAEKQNRAVLKLDPKQGDALYNLGAIYANKQKFIEARQFWNDAVKLAGDSPSGKNAATALTKLPPAA